MPARRARPTTEVLEARETPATFTVTTTADAGAGSLRDAITRANAARGADVITFAIPNNDPGFVDANHNGNFDAGDYWSIAPASALPAVSRRVTLDGWSQRGPDYHGKPVIELNGAGAGAGVNGLTLSNHSGSTVRGLVVNRFTGDGVAVVGGGGHTILGNFLGTDATGTADKGNTGAGLSLTGTGENVVGGTTAGSRNVISGNDLQGVHLAGSGGNQIIGNLIGTTVSGDAALANGSAVYLGDGVRIEGGGFNVIGGDTAAERNVLSGNFDDGIDVRDGSVGNQVLGNYIGVNKAGTGVLGNGADGVFIQDAAENLVGGTTTGEANVIGGNGYNGVFLYGDAHDNTVAGNFIGTNAAGADLGNGKVAQFADGVFFAQFGAPVGPTDNTVKLNTIAFNADSGVAVDVAAGAATAGNTLKKNSVFGNRALDGHLAIDLASDGLRSNDALDADGGPNNLQNAPHLSPSTLSGTLRSVFWSLNSAPNRTYRIEFFASDVSDEGRVFVGALTVTTDASGQTPQSQFTFVRVAGMPFVTATATDLTTGDTSEFSSIPVP